MKKLNTNQKKLVSDFLSNLAIATVSLGILSPLLTGNENPLDSFPIVVTSAIVALVLFWLAVKNLRGKK